MPKKYKSLDYLLVPDEKFNNKVISKFINYIMWDGKKTVSAQVFYNALDEVAKKIQGVAPLDIFNKVIDTVKPQMEVRPKRIGGATYQVPMPVPSKRQISLAIRWIIQAARKKKGKPMHLKLADELFAAYNGEGDAMMTRQNVHKMAEANKAFAHYAY